MHCSQSVMLSHNVRCKTEIKKNVLKKHQIERNALQRMRNVYLFGTLVFLNASVDKEGPKLCTYL